jgi:outer membrane protein assembly factor BamB
MSKLKIDLLVIGVGGHAVAIDPETGTELWRTKLKTSSFITVFHAGPNVFAGAGGELFCLDATSGDILWHNKLKGLGLGVVAFSASTDTVVSAAVQAQRAAATAAAT